MSCGRRFPTPWSVEERRGCFVVLDRSGRALCRVYFKGERGGGSGKALFTRDEARHIADCLAELPELLRRP
jgi:hypothetical protein